MATSLVLTEQEIREAIQYYLQEQKPMLYKLADMETLELSDEGEVQACIILEEQP